ncbi:MAG: YIP1 family protein [Gemmatimonadetes bacterium]|nr:YIP1 family protein [Gemmatimonadota bacterium]
MASGSGSLVDRMMGAAFLSVDTFEEVEHDETATLQAGLVVVIVAVAGGIGALHSGLIGSLGVAGSALVGWAVWAGITYLVGAKLFHGTATWGELLRTLGFAQAPGILLILGFVPLLGWILHLLVPLWMLVAGFIAVRQALDFGNGKTFLTVLVGWLIYVALAALVMR